MRGEMFVRGNICCHKNLENENRKRNGIHIGVWRLSLTQSIAHALWELHFDTSMLHVSHYNSCYGLLVDRLIISICSPFCSAFMEV